MGAQTIAYDYLSPLGPIRLHFSSGFLASVELQPSLEHSSVKPQCNLPFSIRRYLDAYFCKKPISLDVNWFTPPRSTFAQKIYGALQKVGFSEKISYGALAIKAGYSSKHARAIGGVMNRNPWPIFVPCHRVINANGDIGGFAADLSFKRALLQHEDPLYSNLPFFFTSDHASESI